jgi:hypothetical protein
MRLSWQIVLGVVLLVLSVSFYVLHYAIFRDSHHIFVFLVGDIAFVFIEVLLVTLIIHRVLEERERRARLEKLNIVIGAFFSEIGTRMIGFLSEFDLNKDRLRKELIVKWEWPEHQFEGMSEWLKQCDYEVAVQMVDWSSLRDLLMGERHFFLRLLENPNLLEHESFTELLRAVLHLLDELRARGSLKELPSTDYQHLAGDIKRVYGRLLGEWLVYMKYLRDSHPYLFSLALRMNPFDQSASPVVLEPA